MLEKLERAMFLVKEIEKLSGELEAIKGEIRSTYKKSGVINLGGVGHIVITVPGPQWALREGKTIQDCIAALGEENASTAFKVSTHVQVDQEAVKSLAFKNPELFPALLDLVDQKEQTTRIGFRPDQEVGVERKW